MSPSELELFHLIKTAALFLFALCAAVQDLRRRSILLWTFLLFLIPGLLAAFVRLFVLGEGSSAALALLPGLFALFLAKPGIGLLGLGDAFYLLLAACYLTPRELLWMLFAGILFCGVWALFLQCFGMLSGRDFRKYRLPFAVFLFPAVCMVLFFI